MDNTATTEISLFIKEIGFYYFAGIGFALSGTFPSLGRNAGTGETYGQAVASFRRQKFGWGAETGYEQVTANNSLLRNTLTLFTIAVIAAVIWFLLNKLQNPIASIVVGLSFLFLGLKVRNNFKKHWSGSIFEFDFGCIAIALLLYLIR